LPTAVVAEFDDVLHVRAEDASGAFGILPRHADLLTVLATSVVSWRHANGTEGHCAVRGGVLMVSGGERIAIATREAVVGDDLVHLESEVLETFRRKSAEEQSAWPARRAFQLAAMRRILDYLRPGRDAGKRPPLASRRASRGRDGRRTWSPRRSLRPNRSVGSVPAASAGAARANGRSATIWR
jgi:F-type H+-transporting ATPase subunit epsilon